MKDKLTEVYNTHETKQLAKVFEDYMKSIGARKHDGRRKDNTNTYVVHGDCTSWNRVTCYYQKESEKYREENLEIVLRKRAGSYMIISKKGARAFEVSYGDIVYYEEELLKEIMAEHKPLFDMLIKGVNK